MTDKKCRWFKDNGYLTEEGKTALSDFNMGLALLLDKDAVRDMTLDELRVLQSNLAKIVGEAVSNRIISKQQMAAKFQAMTDQQFEAYLENKYGSMWRFMTVTSEEYDRVPVLSKERIEELLEEGAKNVSDFRQPGLILPDRNPHFRR